MTHEELTELMPLLAVGALSDAERDEALRHLKTCRSCAAELTEYQSATNELLRGVPVAPFAPNLETRLRARMLSLNTMPTADAPRRAVLSLRGVRRATLTLVSLAAILLLAFGAWSWWSAQNSIAENSDTVEMSKLLEAPGTTSLNIKGTDRAPTALGQVIFNPDNMRAYLIVNNLPSLPANQIYQAWLTPPDYRRDKAGTFTVDSKGHASVRIWAAKSWSLYKEIEVTAEPLGGSPSPTTPRVMLAVLR